MGSALASSRSVLKLAGIGSVGHRGSFWHLLLEATPLPTPCNVKPVQPSVLWCALKKLWGEEEPDFKQYWQDCHSFEERASQQNWCCLCFVWLVFPVVQEHSFAEIVLVIVTLQACWQVLYIYTTLKVREVWNVGWSVVVLGHDWDCVETALVCNYIVLGSQLRGVVTNVIVYKCQ